MKTACRSVPQDLCVKLEQYCLIEIAGLDAEKYLQGQLTCDVAGIKVGEHTLTAHCDPKGKMSALFRLYRAEEQRFIVIIRRDLLPEALTQLKKYAVFSKVNFSEVDAALFGTTNTAYIADFCDKPTACVIEGNPRRMLFWGEIPPQTNGTATLWDWLDIQQGIPLLLKPNQFELIPQAVNLQCLEQAISFTKGCYIGQETVARAKYRGANKRAMFVLAGQIEGELPEIEIGGSVELQIGDNWKSTGTILAAVIEQQQLWLEVVLNKETEADSRFRLGETPLQIVEPPYRLDEHQ